MHDSWIDKDELEQLVGEFSRRKKGGGKRRPAHPTRPSIEPDIDEPEQQAVQIPVLGKEIEGEAGNEAPSNVEAFGEDSSEDESSTEHLEIFKAGSEDPESVGPDESDDPGEMAEDSENFEVFDFDDDPSTRKDASPPAAGEPQTEFESVEEENPVPEQESIAQAGQIAPEIVSEETNGNLEIGSSEEVEEVEVIESEEVVTRFEVAEPEDDPAAGERAVALLGGSDEEWVSRQESGGDESDAIRAVSALAAARDRARVACLLKQRTEPGDSLEIGDEAEEESTTESETPLPSDEEIPTSAIAEVRVDAFLPLRRRIDRFVESFRSGYGAVGISVFDVDGFFLHRDEESTLSPEEELRLIAAVQSAANRIGREESGILQVSSHGGSWHSLIRGGEGGRIVARLETANPLDRAGLEDWSKVLAEAVDPANAAD